MQTKFAFVSIKSKFIWIAIKGASVPWTRADLAWEGGGRCGYILWRTQAPNRLQSVRARRVIGCSAAPRETSVRQRAAPALTLLFVSRRPTAVRQTPAGSISLILYRSAWWFGSCASAGGADAECGVRAPSLMVRILSGLSRPLQQPSISPEPKAATNNNNNNTLRRFASVMIDFEDRPQQVRTKSLICIASNFQWQLINMNNCN